MRPTLLLPLLLALIHTSFASSESGRFLGSCSEGCLSCHTATNTCLRCEDDLVLRDGACYENYVYKDMIYIKGDHFLLVDIDNDGVDVAVIVIFSILAFVVYMGSLYLMQKEDWKELVPEPKEATKTVDGKEAAKQPTPKGTPKGEHVIEMGQTELGRSPTPKSATPGSPVKSAGQSSHRSKKTEQLDGEDENVKTSPHKANDFDDEEEEEPYYPTKKELAIRNRKDQIREEQEDDEDVDQVEVQVHDGEGEEDEQKTAQETPSPRTDLRSTPNGRVSHHKRKGSNHSDGEYEDDDNRPQLQSNIKNNQHRGNEGEDEDEDFESARSGNGQPHHEEEEEEEEEEQQEEEEEQQQEEEEEEEEQDNDVMDLNDLGLDHKH